MAIGAPGKQKWTMMLPLPNDHLEHSQVAGTYDGLMCTRPKETKFDWPTYVEALFEGWPGGVLPHLARLDLPVCLMGVADDRQDDVQLRTEVVSGPAQDFCSRQGNDGWHWACTLLHPDRRAGADLFHHRRTRWTCLNCFQLKAVMGRIGRMRWLVRRPFSRQDDDSSDGEDGEDEAPGGQQPQRAA
jgi:hypothetical protein